MTDQPRNGDLAADSPTATSPCIGICMLDDNGYCLGCGRSAEQITETLRQNEPGEEESGTKPPERRGLS